MYDHICLRYDLNDFVRLMKPSKKGYLSLTHCLYCTRFTILCCTITETNEAGLTE